MIIDLKEYDRINNFFKDCLLHPEEFKTLSMWANDFSVYIDGEKIFLKNPNIYHNIIISNR